MKHFARAAALTALLILTLLFAVSCGGTPEGTTAAVTTTLADPTSAAQYIRDFADYEFTRG